MEPPPKQGCELHDAVGHAEHEIVSVEPPPKQGCELVPYKISTRRPGLSGTPAEAGVRAERRR